MAGSRRAWGAIRQLRSSGRWQARWPDPVTGQLSPAPSTFPTKTAAGRWLDAKRTDLARGTALDDRQAAQSLRTYWAPYERSLGALKASTRSNYEAAWRLRIEPRFGRVPVGRIRPSHIDDWQQAMVDRGVSASKVIEACGVLKRILDGPLRDRVIPSNPAAQRSAPLPRRPQHDRPVLTPAEVERLVTATRREDDKLIVRLLAYGGLRVGEALALRLIDHDRDRHTLTIRQSVGEVGGRLVVGATKTYAVRTITLPVSLSKDLPASGGSVLMFPNSKGGHRRYRVWRRDSWDPAIKACGFTATPHDLRATCASLLIDAGASVKDVQQHLGHQDITTTLNLYARVRPGRSADLAAKLDALIAEV